MRAGSLGALRLEDGERNVQSPPTFSRCRKAGFPIPASRLAGYLAHRAHGSLHLLGRIPPGGCEPRIGDGVGTGAGDDLACQQLPDHISGFMPSTSKHTRPAESSPDLGLDSHLVFAASPALHWS